MKNLAKNIINAIAGVVLLSTVVGCAVYEQPINMHAHGYSYPHYNMLVR